MNICICDDEKRERKSIRKICENFFRGKSLSCEIWEAENALKVLEHQMPIDLLILDIEMPEMDGVSLKNHLQRSDEQMLVLFVTSHEELMPEAFGMHVIGFIGKEWLKVKLPRYLGLAITLLGKNILIAGKYPSNDVVKIHSEREYCNLFLRDGDTVLIRSSLKDMEESLREADFVRVSRAWMANLRYVERLEKWELLIDGEKLVVSRGYREAFEVAYDSFCEKNARYL